MGFQNKFNKEEAEYNIEELKLKYNFALKLSTIISWTVALIVIALGIFFGSQSLVGLTFIAVIAFILLIITFVGSFRSAMA